MVCASDDHRGCWASRLAITVRSVLHGRLGVGRHEMADAGAPATTAFTYSADGARISARSSTGAGQSYAYDAENRLVAVTDAQCAAAVAAYAYDGDGLRRSKQSTDGSAKRSAMTSGAPCRCSSATARRRTCLAQTAYRSNRSATPTARTPFLLPDTRGSICMVTTRSEVSLARPRSTSPATR